MWLEREYAQRKKSFDDFKFFNSYMPRVQEQ